MKVRSILIVEDDVGLATVLTRIVNKTIPGVHLRWATTARDAIQKIHEQKQGGSGNFDLVLSDLLLPNHELGTSLWSFCREHSPETAFAVMSSVDPTTYFRMFCGKPNPPPFLPKPFRVSDCEALIKDVCRASELRHPVPLSS